MACARFRPGHPDDRDAGPARRAGKRRRFVSLPVINPSAGRGSSSAAPRRALRAAVHRKRWNSSSKPAPPIGIRGGLQHRLGIGRVHPPAFHSAFSFPRGNQLVDARHIRQPHQGTGFFRRHIHFLRESSSALTAPDGPVACERPSWRAKGTPGKAAAFSPYFSGSIMSRNQLDQETSPYLLLHKDDPVQWYPGAGRWRCNGGRGQRQADPALHRLHGLPLVPCHAPRKLRRCRDGLGDE